MGISVHSSQSFFNAPGENTSRRMFARFCNSVIHWTLYALVAVLPVFFLPWTTDVVEFNKQILVLAGAMIMGLAWLCRSLLERRFEYRQTPVNLMVWLFLAAYTISAFLSQAGNASILGDYGQQLAALLTVYAFAVIYFTASSAIATAADLRKVLNATVISGLVLGIFTALQSFKVFILPFDFTKSISFNTVGTLTALGIYLDYIVVVCAGLLLMQHSAIRTRLTTAWSVVIWITGILSLADIVAINFWQVSTALFLSTTLMILFAFVHAGRMKGLSSVALPVLSLVISGILLMFPVNFGFKYPVEVAPSYRSSLDITARTLEAHPLFGSGPGTFIYDYAQYHNPEVNRSSFWSIRFDRATSRVLTLASTLGLVGGVTWLLLMIFVLITSARRLLYANEESWHMSIAMFTAWFLLLVSKIVYSSTMTLEFISWLSMAYLIVANHEEPRRVDLDASPRAAMASSFFLILGIVLSVAGIAVFGMRYAGEVAFAKALKDDNKGAGVDAVLADLQTAIRWNSNNDTFARNISAVYLSKAAQLGAATVSVAQKPGESQTDYDARKKDATAAQSKAVADATAAAVKSARDATTISPNNVADWAALAQVYQTLVGVTSDADTWTLSAYQKAIALEPSNPVFPTEVAKIYILQSDRLQNTIKNGKDDASKKDAQKQSDDLLSQAVDSLNKAIELKPDYAPAHYQLALAWDRQGKDTEAINRLESLVAYNNRDVGVGLELSILYFKVGRKDDAINLLEQVVNIAPSDANARWYLAAFYEDRGDYDKAIAEVQQVDKLSPGLDVVAQKLAELQQKKSGGKGALPAPITTPVQNPNVPGVK